MRLKLEEFRLLNDKLKIVDGNNAVRPTYNRGRSVNRSKIDHIEESKAVTDNRSQNKEENNIQESQVKLKTMRETSFIIALGTIENVELWVPINSKDDNSRVLSLSLSSKINFRDEKVTVHKFNVLPMKLVSSEVESEQQEANILVNRLQMVMINRHLIEAKKGKESQEQVLLPTRLSLIYDKSIKLKDNSEIQNIFVIIEPLDIKVGIREIINFKDIGAVFSDLVDKMDPNIVDENEHQGVVVNSSTSPQQIITREENKTLMAYQNKVNSVGRVKISKETLKKFVKTNVFAKITYLNLSLMDDTGFNEYPLLNLCISNVLAKIEQEEGQDDAVSFILKKMGISKYPVLKLDASLNLDSNVFNLETAAYEPLIEPYDLSASIKQKSKSSLMEINLISDKMMNFNLTYGMALAIKKILTRLDQEDWEDEKEVIETKNTLRAELLKK